MVDANGEGGGEVEFEIEDGFDQILVDNRGFQLVVDFPPDIKDAHYHLPLITLPLYIQSPGSLEVGEEGEEGVLANWRRRIQIQMLDKWVEIEIEEDIASFGFFAIIWDVSISFSHWLLNEGIFKVYGDVMDEEEGEEVESSKLNVLELGCGVALPSIALMKAWDHIISCDKISCHLDLNVVLTDSPEVFELTERNVKINFEMEEEETKNDEVDDSNNNDHKSTISFKDWTKSENIQQLKDDEGGSISCELVPYLWGEDLPGALVGRNFDVILCVDCIFDPAYWTELWQALELLTSQNTIVYISFKQRQEQELDFFHTDESSEESCWFSRPDGWEVTQLHQSSEHQLSSQSPPCSFPIPDHHLIFEVRRIKGN